MPLAPHPPTSHFSPNYKLQLPAPALWHYLPTQQIPCSTWPQPRLAVLATRAAMQCGIIRTHLVDDASQLLLPLGGRSLPRHSLPVSLQDLGGKVLQTDPRKSRASRA
jgi:hypothetical protein